MRIVEPSAALESITPDALRHIERCGRTAYKSERKITEDSAPAFVAMLLHRGHESVLEHASATIRFVCDRGVSHELVRHRLCAFTQESTRYCDYAGEVEVIEPCNDQGIRVWSPPDGSPQDVLTWIRDGSSKGCISTYVDWHTGVEAACRSYGDLRKQGWSPEHARSVLPTCLKTEIVVTANFREWRHILSLRLAAAAHPAMRFVMRLALAELAAAVPVVFDEFLKRYPPSDWQSVRLKAACEALYAARPDLS